MFIDEAQINARGGDGGAGCVSFLREAHRPQGGPDGGDGGRGGDVIFVADANLSTLLPFTHKIHYRAPSGQHGKGKDKFGRAGEDLVIGVPAGTTIRLLHTGQLLADLVAPGDAYVAAHGGRGGRGNARFLSNRRRAPSFAEQGEEGEERWLRLELKLLADVATVGFPNAGKSTFVAAISAARPKIADYPFTTLTPNLGVVRVDDVDFVVADIPGLIEGAAEGKGLGHQFLRHVERSRVLVVLLDPSHPELDMDAQRDVLLHELAEYQPDLLARPRVEVVTKVDLLGDDAPDWVPSGAYGISAATHEGLGPLLNRLAQLVSEARTAAPAPVGFVVHRPEPSGFSISRGMDGASWTIGGPDALRAVALSDLTDAQALDYVQARLRRLGVFDALEEAGIRDGDTVQIGDFGFDWLSDGISGGRGADAGTGLDRERHKLAGSGRKRARRRRETP